jgi:hypothetical protein
VSRHAAISGAEPDPIRVARWLLGDGRSGGGFEGDLVAEDLQLADVVALGAFGTDTGVIEANAEVVELGLLALFLSYGLVRYVTLQFRLLALAVVAGHAALRREAIPERLREHPAPPPRRPS